MRKRIVILGTACALALSGCQGSVTSALKNSAAVTETVEETKPAWSDENELKLYNTYINIYNYMVGRLNESVNRYFEYVDYQEEFTLLNSNDKDYYIYSLSKSQIEELDHANAQLEEKGEKSALDNAYTAMYPSLKQLMECINDIYEYTDMKSYLDDDYAKAKELHTVLLTSLDSYTTTAETFETELLVEESKRREASLQRLKDEGFETLYAINIMLDSVQKLQEELYVQEIYDDNILDMDMEKIQPLYEEFTASVDAVLAASNDESKLAEEGIPIHSAYWSSFLRNMKETKTSMTKVLQKVKEQTPLSQSDTLITMPGNCSLSSFAAGASAMISDYNRFIEY